MFKKESSEKGTIIVIVLFVMVALAMVGAGAILTSTTDIHIAGNDRTTKMAFYAADAGITAARRDLLSATQIGFIGQSINSNPPQAGDDPFCYQYAVLGKAAAGAVSTLFTIKCEGWDLGNHNPVTGRPINRGLVNTVMADVITAPTGVADDWDVITGY